MADFKEATRLEDKITEAITETISDTPEAKEAAKKYFDTVMVSKMIDEAFEIQ